MHRYLTSHRALGLGIALLSLAMIAGSFAGTAAAKPKSCGEKVIGDWFDNGRVDTIYPQHCYRDAIKNLPPDILVYGNAKEEINRARLYAAQGKPDPGGGAPPKTTTTDTTPGDTTTTKTTTSDTTGTDTSTQPPSDTSSTSTTDTSGPSSVPVPLLVLGGLAVLLLAAGSAGYLRRRMNSGGDDDVDGTSPPPA